MAYALKRGLSCTQKLLAASLCTEEATWSY